MNYIDGEDFTEALEIDGQAFEFEHDNYVTISSKVLQNVSTRNSEKKQK